MGSVGFGWPSGEVAAVSLTFDDGMRSQLDAALPILGEWGMTATFYVNPRDDYAQALEEWRPAVLDGHEVGNHTVNHPCSKNFAFISENGRKALEEMSWEEMDGEIAEAGHRLRTLFPEQGEVSFAYPCYQPFIGRGAGRRSYVPLVLKHCVAGRGRGERANDPQYCDLGYLWSWPAERLEGSHLVGLVEQAIAERRWAIFTFHGVHEGHLPVGDGDLAQLCEHLARNRERVWSAPVATIGRWVAERQAVGAGG